MRNLIQRIAKEVDIQPVKIKGMENHGLCYFIWSDETPVAGGQCAFCNTIIWVNSRENRILNEKKPDSIPNHGIEYRKYYQEKLKRFLNELPQCPCCEETHYNLFVNNTSFPRFEDGTVLDITENNLDIIKSNPEKIKIWWLSN